MKNEEKYLTNTTEVSREDYYQYNLLTATLSNRKMINMLLFLVITIVYFIFTFFYTGQAYINFEDGNNLEGTKSILIVFISLVIITINIYTFIKINKYTLFLNRICMCITCATFPMVVPTFSENLGFIILFTIVSILAILSLFTTKFFANKNYQRIGKLDYSITFKPKVLEVEVATAHGQRKNNLEYDHIYKVLEAGHFFYLFISLTEAIIVNKSKFSNGNYEDMMRIFYNQQKIVKLIKW